MKIPGSDYFFLCTEQLITQPGLYFHTTGQLTSSEHVKCRLHLLLHLFVSEETQRERGGGGGELWERETSRSCGSQLQMHNIIICYKHKCNLHMNFQNLSHYVKTLHTSQSDIALGD